MNLIAPIPPPPAVATEKPGLLFLCHRIPYPPDKGEKIRAWHMLRHLATSHRIHLGCLIDDPADWAHLPVLRALCADVAAFGLNKRRARLTALARFRPGRPLSLDYFRSAPLTRWVRRTLAHARVDAILAFSSSMAPYVMHAPGPARRLLDMVDVDSEKFAAYAETARFPMRGVYAREGRTLLAFERQAAQAFERTLFVSGHECERFAALAPESRERLLAVENGVDLAAFDPARPAANPFPTAAPHLVFTGTMDYRPNVDAVVWFARAVMPLLADLGVVFAIVGANPADAVRRLASPSVLVTGRVPDTRPYLAHAAAVVAPLRIARGVQNKALEAMAMARPVIASPQAFEGLRAVPGRDLLVAEGAEAMADAVRAVLAGAHPGLGAAARRAVEAGHDWSRTLAPLFSLLGTEPAR